MYLRRIGSGFLRKFHHQVLILTVLLTNACVGKNLRRCFAACVHIRYRRPHNSHFHYRLSTMPGPYTHQTTLCDYHFVRGTTAPRSAYSRHTSVIPRSTSTSALNTERIVRANITNRPVLLKNHGGQRTYWLSPRYRPTGSLLYNTGYFGDIHMRSTMVHPLDNYLFLAPPFADRLFTNSQDVSFHRAYWF